MSSTDICEQCGGEYSQIAQHWSRSSECEYPSLSQKQREITTGLLMGDGYINRKDDRNPYLKSDMISSNYLTHIDDQFGIFGHGVRLEKTADENAKQKIQSGFSPNACIDDYSDVYRWRSMCHPDLQEFADWYSTGKKVWPDDIQLTPTVLKHWYCGDGHWDNSGSCNRIKIAMANEIKNFDKVDVVFEDVGLPSPSNYNTSERSDGSMRCEAGFTVAQSKELWEYMGKPLPDFEYKWPETFK